jgi:ribosome-binding factor A
MRSNNKGYKRVDRVSRTIQRAVSESLNNDFSDPALKGVMVTRVEVSPDLKHAYVYWYMTVDTDQERKDLAIEAVTRASRRLQARMGELVRLKSTPKLRFQYDTGIDSERQIESLLTRLHDADTSGE